jgi:AraC family transcriptional regulator of adaptative response/methylated-DNA-[protein]-cysteine methyltransferase
LSPAHFQRRFKKLLGASPRQFQEAVRLGRLKQLLRGQAAVSHALLDAGFASQSPGYRAAQRALGMSPAQFRRGGQGEPIDYLTAHCELGELMIAATAQGVCFVQFGADADELKDLLAQEFPRAELRDAAAMSRAAALRGWLKALVRTIDRGAPLTRIPLDLRGTAFQIRVWRELQKISSGATRSYAQVAARLKMPRAVRAVASACARNRIAVLVPCHRVLRGDGELAGYRWGLQRKRALLDKEAAKATKAD